MRIGKDAEERALNFQPQDYELFLDHLTRAYGVVAEHKWVIEIFQELKRFLIVKAENPETALCPSEWLDKAWHVFLCFTEDYHNFCAILGPFVHHRPTRVSSESVLKETIRLMNQRFNRKERVHMSCVTVRSEDLIWMTASQRERYYKDCRRASQCG